MKIYLVGGAVRDLLLGDIPKDLDYTCEASFSELRDFLINTLKVRILNESPKYLTFKVMRQDKTIVDFACCREEANYDGRRPELVKTASIYSDLSRRDFTVNAMAMEVDQDFKPTGNLIDPFGGQQDLEDRVLRFVGNAEDRIAEDGLRWLRAIRFLITKKFLFTIDTAEAVFKINYDPLTKVSVERVREELIKCFRADTLQTIQILSSIPNYWMKEGLWLEPTLKV